MKQCGIPPTEIDGAIGGATAPAAIGGPYPSESGPFLLLVIPESPVNSPKWD